MILPFIECIANSYDSKDGSYYKPPSILKGYKDGQPVSLTKEQRQDYSEQSRSLYCVILTILKETGMAKITQEFKCGMNSGGRGGS